MEEDGETLDDIRSWKKSNERKRDTGEKIPVTCDDEFSL